MRVDEFDFDLPDELIALRPASPRSASRLLCVAKELVDRQFSDIIEVLQPGDLLVRNNTKVIPAALRGIRPARDEQGQDTEVEINLHKSLASENMKEVRWRAFARPAKRLREGDKLIFSPILSSTVIMRNAAEVELKFNTQSDSFSEALQATGEMPLPPYIGRKREVDEKDQQDYQTVFATRQGSVAAPTAGLHFTDEIFTSLEKKHVRLADVTLHVGAGTFLPVTAEDTKDHQMHAEWGEVSPEVARLINETHAAGNKVISVGTTSLRLLESAAGEHGVEPFSDETDIFITPGFRFRAVDALITNFHLPRSTLFMLVSAFSGHARMKAAYAHAVTQGYRFYSYGDACYLERHDQ